MNFRPAYALTCLATSSFLGYYSGSLLLGLSCFATQLVWLVVMVATKPWRDLQSYRLKLASSVFRKASWGSGAILIDETPGKYRFEVLFSSVTNALRTLSENLEDRVKVERLLNESLSQEVDDG